MYVVVVTWGTVPNMAYASAIRDWNDAQKLLEAAYERGYRDARIVDERDFFAPRTSAGRGSTRPAAAA